MKMHLKLPSAPLSHPVMGDGGKAKTGSTWQLVWSICEHYNDVIMGEMASQITSLTIVYWNVYPGADQRKHQSSASLAFVWGIHRGPVNSAHKWPVTRKMFQFDDVIMIFYGPLRAEVTSQNIKRFCKISSAIFSDVVLNGKVFALIDSHNVFEEYWCKCICWWQIKSPSSPRCSP